MNNDYREIWFESAFKRAYNLGYTLYRCITPDDDAFDGYILEDGATNGIDGIFTAYGVEEELARIEREDNDDDNAAATGSPIRQFDWGRKDNETINADNEVVPF